LALPPRAAADSVRRRLPAAAAPPERVGAGRNAAAEAIVGRTKDRAANAPRANAGCLLAPAEAAEAKHEGRPPAEEGEAPTRRPASDASDAVRAPAVVLVLVALVAAAAAFDGAVAADDHRSKAMIPVRMFRFRFCLLSLSLSPSSGARFDAGAAGKAGKNEFAAYCYRDRGRSNAVAHRTFSLGQAETPRRAAGSGRGWTAPRDPTEREVLERERQKIKIERLGRSTAILLLTDAGCKMP
jgi:hypothetical protein